jgi:hypothetical protein
LPTGVVLPPLWSGQASPLGREMPAKALTLILAKEAVERFKYLDDRLNCGPPIQRLGSTQVCLYYLLLAGSASIDDLR